jgi:hypothetical protein
MSEIARIARLLKQTFEGNPYYGPSVLEALGGVDAEVAAGKPTWSAHSIWDLVTHLTAELVYARTILEGNPGPWMTGKRPGLPLQISVKAPGKKPWPT